MREGYEEGGGKTEGGRWVEKKERDGEGGSDRCRERERVRYVVHCFTAPSSRDITDH